MKLVYKIDTGGYWVEDVLVEKNMPSDCVEIKPPYGLIKPRYINNEWIEGATQEEIEIIRNTPVPPSELDILKKQQTDLVFELMMKGVL